MSTRIQWLLEQPKNPKIGDFYLDQKPFRDLFGQELPGKSFKIQTPVFNQET
jgi:hypothetical protein